MVEYLQLHFISFNPHFVNSRLLPAPFRFHDIVSREFYFVAIHDWHISFGHSVMTVSLKPPQTLFH